MPHAGFAIAAIALVATLAETSSRAEMQTESPQRTLWDHNGSVMYLVANGLSREFYYQKPRPGMLDAGARPGSLLFRGQVNSGQFLGTAYIFNPHCGPIAFEVKGPSLDGDERIVLTGQAPLVGQNCRAHGSHTTTLEFRRAKLDAANQSQEALPAVLPPAIAAKPELKPDAPPADRGDVPRSRTAQHQTRNEAPSTPKEPPPVLVDSTPASTGQTVPNQAPANDLNKYLWGVAFIVMIAWLLIKLFGKTLIGMK